MRLLLLLGFLLVSSLTSVQARTRGSSLPAPVEEELDQQDRELVIFRWREWLELFGDIINDLKKSKAPSPAPSPSILPFPTSLPSTTLPPSTLPPSTLPPTEPTPAPTTSAPLDTRCSCTSCTDAAWDTLAGEFSCGARIGYLASDLGAFFDDPLDACRFIGQLEHPADCSACDPDSCDGRVPEIPESYCGCQECTHEIWQSPANGGSPCGARITWLATVEVATHPTQASACRLVASQESECAGCNPDTCTLADDDATHAPSNLASADPTASPTVSRQPVAAATPVPTQAPTVTAEPTDEGQRCGCATCADEIWDLPAGDFTCGERIDYLVSIGLPELVACRQISGQEFPSICGPGCDPDYCDGQCPSEPSPEGYRCGCEACTDDVWNTDANGFTCGERISYVASQGACPAAACRKVARFEHPNECGPSCDPDLCGGRTLPPSPLTLGPATPLYCYPPYEGRTRWTDAWGDYILEVKEGVCGPGDNAFTNSTVQFETDELTMDYKMVDGVWQASEVRIVMPQEQMPYKYGTYRFSVKTVEVIDSETEQVVSDALPPSLVLGMFTWDDTEHFASHENYNHEVDVELSRWGIPGNSDAQFLVQPPEIPQYYRYSTGPDGTMDQGGHSYEFTWNPGEITWYTDANGGVSHSYTTEQALSLGLRDYVQCLPADMEVRINLWNLYGAGSAPNEMQDTHIARVVIDDFVYVPSGIDHVVEGGYCSKGCQCGPDLQCRSGLCQSA